MKRPLNSLPSRLRSLVARLRRDEQGGEVLEYVLIAGLIIVGCIAAITAFGERVLERWNAADAPNL